MPELPSRLPSRCTGCDALPVERIHMKKNTFGIICIAAVVLATPVGAQSPYPRPNKGIDAPLSWLQQFNGAYIRPQDKPDGAVRPTANLISAMDSVIIPLLQPW